MRSHAACVHQAQHMHQAGRSSKPVLSSKPHSLPHPPATSWAAAVSLGCDQPRRAAFASGDAQRLGPAAWARAQAPRD